MPRRVMVAALTLVLVAVAGDLPAAAAGKGPKVRATDCRFRPVPTPVDSLHAIGLVVAAANDVWQFGEVTTDNGSTQLPALARHWNGATWSDVAMPGQTYFGGVAITPTDVWAVGPSGFAHWDGHSWSLAHGPFVGSRHPFTVSAVATNDVWASGQRLFGWDHGDDLFHFDGTSWSIVSVPGPASGSDVINGVKALGPHDVWVVGEHDENNHETGLVKHWDGTVWADVPNGFVTADPLYRLDSIDGASSDLWIGGYDFSTSQLLVEHWNGAAVTGTTYGSHFEPVHLSWRAPDDAWMEGADYTGSGLNFNVEVSHWDGVGWTAVPLAAAPQPGQIGGVAAVLPSVAWAVADGASSPPWGPGVTQLYSCQKPHGHGKP